LTGIEREIILVHTVNSIFSTPKDQPDTVLVQQWKGLKQTIQPTIELEIEIEKL
jgi:hypothetical protein